MTSDPSRVTNSLARESRPTRRWFRLAAIVFVLGLLVAAIDWLRWELRAYSVLVHFEDPAASGIVARSESKDVRTENVSFPVASEVIPARLYLPFGVAHPPGIVVVHGIHHLGIDDPRFVSFARALAGDGFAVFTPVVASLADYHVDAASIPTIGASAGWLAARLGADRVTMITLSFSGGLALLAACEPQYAAHLRALVVFGSYDDLARVSRFLATSEALLPDGQTVHLAAHDYGASVFVYAHLGQFFAPADVPAAHDALRAWLWERPDDARPAIEKLSPEGRAVVESLMARRVEDLRTRLLEAIHADEPNLEAISPSGKLAQLRVPVFVIHGSTDSVIPYTESLWLAKDIPLQDLRGVLITPVFTHVDPKAASGTMDELRLVNFIARILHAANG